MKIEVVMPKMGESLQEGTIIRWLKKPGDAIERDEMILEISTDKVDTEVPAPSAGILTEVLARENEVIEVGKVIAVIETEAPAAVPSQPAATEPVQPPTPTTEPAQAPTTTTEPVQPPPATDESHGSSEKRFYSPLVRSIAESEGISTEELDTITGSGAEGRVNKADLLNYIEQKKAAASPAAPPPAAPVQPPPPPPAEPAQPVYKPAPAIAYGVENEIIPMDRMRQLIAEHMVYSWHTSPHVTTVDEADVTHIVQYREKHKAEFEAREGFKLTYTPFFAKAAIEGLKAYPMVNVSVDGKDIVRHLRINLSIAVALAEGNLIVPVIKNADALNLDGLARSVYDLSTRARAKKLNPDDIQGGTFTITNFGTFGNLSGAPIINQPQTAILGIGVIKKRPVARQLNGEWVVAVRDMAYISLTFDHRVIDGMLAGKCLSSIVKALENMDL